ncbi:MAG: STAS/SEC14 domain-containing protein [Lysobacterales bacterium]
MAITILELAPDSLEVIIVGTMEKSDYDVFVPAVEKRIDECGEANLLLNVSNFEGWSPKAIWEDLKFDIKHYNDISRLALLAANSEKEWMATLSKPFTGAKVKFFSLDAHESARQWVINKNQATN